MIVDSSKAFARAHELKNTSEMSGERENHRHMSERHKPNTRENSTSVLLATECDMRGVQQIEPIHLALRAIFKGEVCKSNDLHQ
jgi:hypothetical protein